ncbi:kinesin light chain-like protein [Metarhizium robertsii]|uniref:Tetratricopeptide repeat protein n=2 Tax=Metarhizium robertsii TaxID=568076 RepID=E9ETF1_METRA|nr:Tetratricopeptide repeat protein [Metarhizium robertsii ARSEF 23]EFZ00704.1 Tetratricopeptide repeat protein [Metarhizium robertsii ARSEF 23]EXV03213.1 kinesin light chain-like protein [Metarhizium robertsii]
MEPLNNKLHQLRRSLSRHRTGERIGLQVLCDPEDAKIDIVAVHGLGAQGFSSWVTSDSNGGKPKPWLKELLGADIPNARIMTYGYISDGRSYGFLVGDLVHGWAVKLAYQLARKRQGDKASRRPLFFIAHSLGGWIVKRALIHSREAADRQLRDIELSTCGVAFLGTLSPRRPSSPSPLVQVIRRTTSNLTDLDTSRADTEYSSQQRLADNMEWLNYEMEAFKAIADNLLRLSFYETEKTQDGFVVDRRFSMAGSDGVQIGLKATHSDLVRFHGRDDNYQVFISNFRDMVDKSATSGLLESKQRAFDSTAVHRLEYPAQGYSIPYRLPGEPNTVIPRQDLLDRLDHMLSSDVNPMTLKLGIVNLWGLAGTGKSALARHYAEINCDKLSFVFWFRSESWETIAASYLEFANTIVEHYAKEIPRSQVEDDLGFAGVEDMLKVKSIMQLDKSRVKSVVHSVKDWLLRPENTGWLLVFDNVGPSHDLFDFIPVTLSGKIILTSRYKNCCDWSNELQVGVMEEEEAVRLLDAIVGNNAAQDPAEALTVVEKLSYHPQSIATAAATIRNKGMSILEYHAMLQASTSMTLLGSSLHQSPLTKTVLQISAMLSTSVIPVALFSATSQLDEAPERLRPILGEIRAFQDSGQMDDVLQYLLDQNFIKTPSSPSDTASSLVPSSPSSLSSSQTSAYFDAFVVDPEAREYVRGMLSDEEKIDNAWMACNVCVDGIKNKAAQSTTVQEIHDFGRIMGPHAKTCFDDWADVLQASSDEVDVAWHILGQVCMTQGDIDQAIGCFASSLRRQPNRMDAEERIQVALRLSSLLQETGRHTRSSEVLAGIDVASADQDLGFKVALARASATAALGELEDAKHQYQTLELEQEEALGPLDATTVSTVQKLAANFEQRGKHDVAKALYSRVYISYQNIYGHGDRMTLDALDDLANSLMESKALDEAENLYKQSIDIQTRALGPHHPQTAYAIRKLALIDYLRGRYADAKVKYQQALDIIAPTLGKGHPSYTATLEDMALSCRRHGNSLAQCLPPRSATSRTTSILRRKKTKSIKIKEDALAREVSCRRAFEEAEKLYLDVLTIKKSARQMYSEDKIDTTWRKLEDMYEYETFFDENSKERLEKLEALSRECRRRGTV